MNRDPDERAQPEGGRTPDEFDAIVAAWQAEGLVPAWPDDDRPASATSLPGAPPDSPPTDPPRAAPLLPGPPRPEVPGIDPLEPDALRSDAVPPGRPARPDAPVSNGPPPDVPTPATASGPVRPYPVPPPDEEHFVPPEPPPLPRLGPPVIVGLVVLALGLVLVVAPGWVGVPDRYGLPLGLLGLAAGLGWLVLRLWPESPSGDGNDDGGDGAVL